MSFSYLVGRVGMCGYDERESMSLKVKCDDCGEELNEPGALVFGRNGLDGRRLKQHICVRCWGKLEAMCVPVITHTVSTEVVMGIPDQQGHVQEYRIKGGWLE